MNTGKSFSEALIFVSTKNWVEPKQNRVGFAHKSVNAIMPLSIYRVYFRSKNYLHVQDFQVFQGNLYELRPELVNEQILSHSLPQNLGQGFQSQGCLDFKLEPTKSQTKSK